MFRKKKDKILESTIKNACKGSLLTYEKEIKTCINRFDDEDLERLLMKARQSYLDDVYDSVVSALKLSSTTIAARMELLLMSPELCGIEQELIQNGIGAGALYCMCYYALNDQIGDMKKASELNHFQNDLMNNILNKLDNENQEEIFGTSDDEKNYDSVLEKILNEISTFSETEFISNAEYWKKEVCLFAGIDMFLRLIFKYKDYGIDWYSKLLLKRGRSENQELYEIFIALTQSDISERFDELFSREDWTVDEIFRRISYGVAKILDMNGWVNYEKAVSEESTQEGQGEFFNNMLKIEDFYIICLNKLKVL